MCSGCSAISLARFIFGSEPKRVWGTMQVDPEFKTDRLTSGVLEFGQGIATFTCATQLTPYQRVNIFGTEGRIEIEMAFNAPPDQPCRIWHQRGSEIEEIVFDVCNQYTMQGDLFSLAVLNETEGPKPLEDADVYRRVIDDITLSAAMVT